VPSLMLNREGLDILVCPLTDASCDRNSGQQKSKPLPVGEVGRNDRCVRGVTKVSVTE